MIKNKTSVSSRDNSGFATGLILISIVMATTALILSFTTKDMTLPESLDYMCSDFSEKYDQFFEYENDISSISQEKAYKSKVYLDDQLTQYRHYLDYWSNPNYKAKKLISNSDERTKIVVNHVYNKSCEPYWEYVDNIRPKLVKILEESKNRKN